MTAIISPWHFLPPQSHQQRTAGHVPAQVPGRSPGGGRGGHGAGEEEWSHLCPVPLGRRVSQEPTGQKR